MTSEPRTYKHEKQGTLTSPEHKAARKRARQKSMSNKPEVGEADRRTSSERDRSAPAKITAHEMELLDKTRKTLERGGVHIENEGQERPSTQAMESSLSGRPLLPSELKSVEISIALLDSPTHDGVMGVSIDKYISDLNESNSYIDNEYRSAIAEDMKKRSLEHDLHSLLIKSGISDSNQRELLVTEFCARIETTLHPREKTISSLPAAAKELFGDVPSALQTKTYTKSDFPSEWLDNPEVVRAARRLVNAHKRRKDVVLEPSELDRIRAAARFVKAYERRQQRGDAKLG